MRKSPNIVQKRALSMDFAVVCKQVSQLMNRYIYDRRAQSAVSAIVQRPLRKRHGAALFALYMVSLLALAAIPSAARAAYLLGPGDLLKITVFKNADLSLDVRVSDSGSIGYPLIGAVPVGGLTLDAAEKKIAKMLQDGGFVVNPQISILLTQGFNDLVSVIGEVNKPGRYSTEASGGHLSGMLASAGSAPIVRRR